MTGSRQTGRVVFVTGGSGGIGRGICLRLAEAGLAVAVHGYASIDGPQAVRDELRAAGARAEAYQADVASEEEVERLFADVVRDFGRVDCLVSNAGIFPRSAVVDMAADEWDRVLGVNLRGTFLTCRAMARHLKERQVGSAGRIVTISSGSAQRGMPRGAHYSASKAAVIGFTKSLALELAPDRIIVNCVAPGTIDTRMPRIDATEEFLAERGRTVVPLGRMGQPSDVAEVVAFLLDERVTWLTGQTIWVNGGELLQ
jgi:NAD(P)-dependent dehydrogenase (short-subunit alcohol dehydrogenase family)